MRKLSAFILLIMWLCMGAQSQSDVFGPEARWISVPASESPVMPRRLTVFCIDFDIALAPGNKARIYYGLDDPRLMTPRLNIFGLAARPGESYVAAEFDASGKVNLVRRGLCPADSAEVTVAIFDAPALSDTSRPHSVRISSNLGNTEISVDGQRIGRKGVNPLGNGGDYLSFPALCKIAVNIPDEGKPWIAALTARHLREPANAFFTLADTITSPRTVSLPERGMPRLRTSFSIDSPAEVDSAIMTATARGIYDITLNGHAVDPDYFKPGYTQYNKTFPYRRHDLRPYLREGANVLEVCLGEGWWSGPATFMGEYRNLFGDMPALLAAIDIRSNDGHTKRIVTEPSNWETAASSRLKGASFFDGEVFDATATDIRGPAAEAPLEGHAAPWDWSATRFVEHGPDRITAVDTLTAVAMTEPRPGVYVYDMGQNCSAVPLVHLGTLPRGRRIELRYSEVLYPDMPAYKGNEGMVMTENLRAALCHDIYTAAGTPGEAFSPRTTLHGYRYVEIAGLPAPLPLDSVKMLALSSIPRIRAHYECSDTLVNRLWQNICWSTLSNFISIPTDCPQRNERLGWMGDISVYSPTAMAIADVRSLLDRYLQSVRDCTTPDGKFPDIAPTGLGFGGFLWGSAGITVPYEHFRQYGDTALARVHYSYMKRYIDYILANAMDSVSGKMVQSGAWGDLGDWLSPVNDRDDKSLLWEAYLIYDLSLMRDMAAALGHADDAARYDAMRRERTGFFNRTFVDPVTARTTSDTQASYALPIAFGINRNEAFVNNFVNAVTRSDRSDGGIDCPPYSLMTGFIGTAWISKALSAVGRSDLAYKLLCNTSWPSWLYPVTQGATSIWERLDSYTHSQGFGTNNNMNSFNHYSFGAVGSWLTGTSLGIDAPADASCLSIAPIPDFGGGITRASGYVDTDYGRVESAWELTPDAVVYRFSIPEGVKGSFTPYGGKTKTYNSGKYEVKCKR